MSFQDQIPWVLDSTTGEYRYWNSREGAWVYQSGRVVYVAELQTATQPTARSPRRTHPPPVSLAPQPAASQIAGNAAAAPSSSSNAGYTVRRYTNTSSNDSIYTDALSRRVSIQQAPSTLPALDYHHAPYRAEQPRVSSLASNFDSFTLGERLNPQAPSYGRPAPVPPQRSQGSNASAVASAAESLPSIDSEQAAQLSRRGIGPVRALSEDRRLDTNFKQRHRRFFRFGRVFKALWPEPGGTDGGQAGSSSAGPGGRSRDPQYGEPIYTKIRWFVVVRPGTNKCSCVTMVTYQQQGVAKAGVVKEEHAVAYLNGSRPEMTQRELPVGDERGMRRPICIQADEPSYTLDPMTRIDYSRTYTVEHNVKAMSFGLVHEHYKDRLWYTFRDVFFDESDDEDDDDHDEGNGDHRGAVQDPPPAGRDGIQVPERTSSRNTITPRTMYPQQPTFSSYPTSTQPGSQVSWQSSSYQSSQGVTGSFGLGQQLPIEPGLWNQGQASSQIQDRRPSIPQRYDPLPRPPQQEPQQPQPSYVEPAMRETLSQDAPSRDAQPRDRPWRDERRPSRRPSKPHEEEPSRPRRGTGRSRRPRS